MKRMIVAFFVGVLSLYVSPINPDLPSYIAFLLFIPFLILAIIFPRFRLFFFFLCGFFWALYRSNIVLDQILPELLEGEDLVIEGTIVDLPKRSDRRQQFTFQADLIDRLNEEDQGHYKFRLNWYSSYKPTLASKLNSEQNLEKIPDLKPGQRWRLKVRVKRPNGFMNPGGRDYEATLFQKSINATGYIKKGKYLGTQSGNFEQKIHQWRSLIYNDLKSTFPDLNGIIPALALGIRDDLSKSDWDILKTTGTIHLVAISGLHIGLIAVFGFFIGRWLWSLPVNTLHLAPASKVAAFFAIITAFIYAGLAGFTIPTQRALIMIVTFMVCVVLNKQTSRFDMLALSLLGVLILSPSSVLSVGFWLSFTAVGIIFYTVNGRTYAHGLWHSAFKIHFILALGLSPLLLTFFGQNPLSGPLANIIAVPFFGLLITPLVLLGVLLLNMVRPSGEGLIKLADYLIGQFWPFLEWIAGLPHNLFYGTISSIPILISSFFGIAILLLPRGFPARGMGLIFIAPVFLSDQNTLNQGEFDLTLLDVGQGLSSVIKTQNHTLVYDTGAKFSDDFDAGKAVVIPYLKSIKVNKINKVVISHGDNDHIGGFQSLNRAISIDQILTSVPDEIEGSAIQTCSSEQNWQWDGVKFSFLYPNKVNTLSKSDQIKSNNRSCVLRVDNGHKSILLPGDIEAVIETRLLKDKSSDILDADILIAPHHGSKTSSSEAFISATSPEYVLLSTGYRNRYKHPHEDVLNTYRKHHVKILNTASVGAIRFRIGKTLSQPDQFRQDHGHFWNRNHVE
ncbi:MAG: DNA internalization-related competence protein ComEC/Rec2 [Gammaproteobacteria bacterium]